MTPPQDASWEGAERRREPRRPANVPARLFYGAGFLAWADCLIKDRSLQGAKVQVPAIFPLSSELVLLDYQAGEVFLAQRRWRKNDMAGLWLQEQCDQKALEEPRMKAVREALQVLSGG